MTAVPDLSGEMIEVADRGDADHRPGLSGKSDSAPEVPSATDPL